MNVAHGSRNNPPRTEMDGKFSFCRWIVATIIFVHTHVNGQLEKISLKDAVYTDKKNVRLTTIKYFNRVTAPAPCNNL